MKELWIGNDGVGDAPIATKEMALDADYLWWCPDGEIGSIQCIDADWFGVPLREQRRFVLVPADAMERLLEVTETTCVELQGIGQPDLADNLRAAAEAVRK